jgi:hypothetical protein
MNSRTRKPFIGTLHKEIKHIGNHHRAGKAARKIKRGRLRAPPPTLSPDFEMMKTNLAANPSTMLRAIRLSNG